MAESVITPELKKAIGMEGKKIVLEIDKTMIRRFAEAVDDPNPLWNDDDYARKSRFGRMVAPPFMLCASMMTGGESRPKLPVDHLKRILDGGGEWECVKPFGAGDVITGSTKFVGVSEREGKAGMMAFLSFETVLKNQKGEVVATCKGTSIHF